MVSGALITANGNTIFTVAMLNMMMKEGNISPLYHGAWGDDCYMVISLPAFMTPVQAVEYTREIDEMGALCGQKLDTFNSFSGRLVDMLQLTFVGGTYIGRPIAYDSEHKYTTNNPADITSMVTKNVTMCMRGLNSHTMNTLLLMDIVLGMTSSVFGKRYYIDVFTMLFPGGSSPVLPVGYPQPSSTNYLNLLIPRIFPEIESIGVRPMLPTSYEVGERMLATDPPCVTKIGGIEIVNPSFSNALEEAK
jgi:hypothetical protein